MSKNALILLGHPTGGWIHNNTDRIDCLYRSHERIKEHILDHNDLDIFIHTWDHKFVDRYLDLYKPKRYLVEKRREVPYRKEMYDLLLRGKNLQLDPDYIKYQLQSILCRIEAMWNLYVDLLEFDSSIEDTYTKTFLTRPDVSFFKKIVLDELDNKYIYIGSDNKVIKEDGSDYNLRAWRQYSQDPNKTFERVQHSEQIPDLFLIGVTPSILDFMSIKENLDIFFDQEYFGLGNEALKFSAHSLWALQLKYYRRWKNTQILLDSPQDYILTRHTLY